MPDYPNSDAGPHELEVLEGALERLVYASDSNDFVVGRISVKGRKTPVTVVGSLPQPRLGEVLILRGRWQHDKKFGEQFRFEIATSRAPSTVQGMEKYLSSGMIHGIGPEMARRITSMFAETTLDIIESRPDLLRKVPGIGKVRAAKISEAFREQKAVREVMLFLQTQGISSGYAAKIYKRFGENSVKVVTMNPYCLATEIHGIGFKSADKIAGNIGFDLRSKLRAEAGLIYLLETAQGEGHVYSELEELLNQGRELLGMDVSTLSNCLTSLIGSGRVVREEDRIYTSAMAYMENSVAKRLRDLISTPRLLPPIKVDAAITWIQGRTRMQLSEAQAEAIRAVMDHKALIITGGPGTGKTTLLRSLLEILDIKRVRSLLAAPTGRAAKRLSEATGKEAKTVHRLLEYSPSERGFQRNASRCLEADVIIVDEASMVDLTLMHNLLSAIGDHSTLILVGDADQLPSVGPGNVLEDLINSGKIAVVRLDTIFRQAQTSMIITNAHLVNQGHMPVRCDDQDRLCDFYLIEKDDPEECVRIIKEMVCKRIPDRFGFDPMVDVQVLSPMRKGALGTENLNYELREALNPAGALLKGDRLRIGDRVMQVRNNYDKDVFNGDVGRILSFNPEASEVAIDFDGREVIYHISELDELSLAYAVTIHKSQGSEYKAVIIPLATQHFVLLRRNLLYTAMTRGKNLVVLLGSRKAMAMAVENRSVEPRHSHLAYKI
jgi:exodeoxyribonuclease V alpha subunit